MFTEDVVRLSEKYRVKLLTRRTSREVDKAEKASGSTYLFNKWRLIEIKSMYVKLHPNLLVWSVSLFAKQFWGNPVTGNCKQQI